MSIVAKIQCDGCPASVAIRTGRMRDHQAPKGWTRTRGTGGGRRLRLDYCPRCSARRAAARMLAKPGTIGPELWRYLAKQVQRIRKDAGISRRRARPGARRGRRA